MNALARFTLLLGLLAAGTASARPTPVPLPNGVRPGGEADPAKGIPGPLTGSLEITNERHRPVEVFLDGTFALELPALSTRILPDVANGVRLVTYGNRRDFQTDRVEIRIDRKVALRIAPLRGQVTVRNTSGLPMRITLDEFDLGVVAPDREVTSQPLPAGTYVVTATPRERAGRPQIQDVLVQPGETSVVALRPLFASLRVDNPYPHAVNVYVDGSRETRLERLASLVIPDLVPGRVTVEMRQRGERLAGDTLELMAGTESRWAPRPLALGTLEVYNPTGSVVTVSLGRGADFMLRPREHKAMTVEAGQVQVQLTTRDGKSIVHDVRVRADQTERFEVPRVWVSGSRR